MDFTEDPDHRAIREAVREVCARFPDEYWAERDESHTFPWEFYDAMAEGGWIGIAIPEEYGGGGPRHHRGSIVLEEVAASGAGMNGCSAIHLSIFGMDPVVKHGSERAEAALPAPGRDRRPARRVRRHRAGRGHRHHRHPHPRRPRRRPLPGHRAQGLDDQGAGVPSGCCCWPAPRRSRRCAEAHRRADAVPRRPQDPAVTIRRSPSWAATPSPPARSSSTTCAVAGGDRRRRGGQGLPLPARRAQRRAGPGRRRGARHRPGGAAPRGRATPTSAWCSAGPIGQNQGDRVPAGRGPHPARRGRADGPRRRPGCIDHGLPCGERGQHGQVPRRRGRLLRRRRGHADPRRLRLRHASTTSSGTCARPG